ncbi:MAG: hypothetical protein Q9208_002650 [Pyrenodesmia sp. 3 TL-2023]
MYAAGLPGSGKTFHCQRAAKEMHHVRHIDMSKLLHDAEQEAGFLHAREVYRKTPAGTLINAGLAVAELNKDVGEMSGDAQETILLEGFPPNIEHAQEYFKETQRSGSELSNPKSAISLTCPEAIAQDRRINRGGPRDGPEIAHVRCKAYSEETVPAIAYLQQGNKCKVVEVSADKSGMEGWLVFQDGLAVGRFFCDLGSLRWRS